MAAPIAGGTKSKAEGVATAVNSMLNQLTSGPDVRVAIVGYGGGGNGVPTAEIRWTGPLAGRALVNSAELAAAPAVIEERIRRIPGVDGIGIARQETIQFPVWYVPGQSGGGGFPQAVDFVSKFLAEAENDRSGKPPLVIHLCGKMPLAEDLRSDSTRAALATFFACHLHLGTSDRIPATLYPSSNQHLAARDVAALFDVSHVLPDSFVGMLRTVQVTVTAGARGLVHQAHMGDLIRFLMLAKAYATSGPDGFASLGVTQPVTATAPTLATMPVASSPPADAVPGVTSRAWDRLALIVMADRSQADPASGAWLRRQEQVNDIIARIAKRNGGDVDVSLILYGNEALETGFVGPLQGKSIVPDVELADEALRVEQVIEKVSNGIGGLVELTRNQLIFLDSEATAPATNLDAAMTALAETIQHARELHEGDRVLPLVMHITGAGFSVEAVAVAASALAKMGDVLVYHSIVPEQLQRTIVYPADAEQIANPTMASLWQWTSPLAGADQIAAKRKTINPASRGLVIGAKFDLLIESIQALLMNPDP